MSPSMNCVLAFGILSVLSGVSHAVPLPADEDILEHAEDFIFFLGKEKSGRSLYEQQQPFGQLKKLPFSLDLQPPLPDSSFGAGKPAVLPLRDSYGNPIPPAVLGVDPSGPDYGVHSPNGNTISIKKTINMQGINFPIPSYASGITEIHRPSDGLLPPFDNNNRKPTQDTQSVPSPNSEISRPSIDLLPPISVTLPKDDRINEISGTLTFNTPISDTPSASLNASPSAATQTIARSSTKTTSPKSTPVRTETSRDSKIKEAKYTGGFGGASGVLGEQKKVGYAVSSTVATTNAPVKTTPIPPTTSSTTPLATTTSTAPEHFRDVITRSSIDEPSRIPIGVSPPSQINIAVPALAKVLLPPHENSLQRIDTSDFIPEIPEAPRVVVLTPPTTTRSPRVTTTPHTTTTIQPTTTTTQRTTTTARPTTTTTPRPTTTTTPRPTTTTTPRPTTTSTSAPIPTIDLASIPFPTTIPLEVLVKGFEPKPVASGVPTLSTILLPPRFSSIAKPFQLPPPPPDPAATSLPAKIPTTSAPSAGRDTFLSLPFGFQNAPANESPQQTVIGKALQEKFGSSINPQQLPTFINDLQTPSKPSQQALVPVSRASEPEDEEAEVDSPAVPPLPIIPPAPTLPAATIPRVPSNPAASFVPAPVQPAPIPTASASNPSAAPDASKYTGGFGGAAGVLGAQKQVGYAVKPEGSAAAAPTEAVQAPAPVAPVIQVAPVVQVAPVPPQAAATAAKSDSKYSGGFGGPPGVLTPYDNVKKDS